MKKLLMPIIIIGLTIWLFASGKALWAVALLLVVAAYLVFVKYTDGSIQNVKVALKSGNIKINDLDKYGIKYFAQPKLIEDIVDLTQSGKLATADALEGFYRDDNYTYFFTSIKSQYVIVYYVDGTKQNVKEALVEGKIKISDLDWFGIEYGKEPLKDIKE